MSESLPNQYDVIELIDDFVSKGVLIPAGTRGTVVELHGETTEAYTVEFNHEIFGDGCLPDLRASQIRVFQRVEGQ